MVNEYVATVSTVVWILESCVNLKFIIRNNGPQKRFTFSFKTFDKSLSGWNSISFVHVSQHFWHPTITKLPEPQHSCNCIEQECSRNYRAQLVKLINFQAPVLTNVPSIFWNTPSHNRKAPTPLLVMNFHSSFFKARNPIRHILSCHNTLTIGCIKSRINLKCHIAFHRQKSYDYDGVQLAPHEILNCRSHLNATLSQQRKRLRDGDDFSLLHNPTLLLPTLKIWFSTDQQCLVSQLFEYHMYISNYFFVCLYILLRPTLILYMSRILKLFIMYPFS